MNKEDLLDFLTPSQQQAVKDYEYLDITNVRKIPVRRNDYIKFMYKYNYQFMEGGIVIETQEWPVIRLKSYEKAFNNFYKLDLSKVYVFHKKAKKISRRDFFEDLLENLGNGQLKKSP